MITYGNYTSVENGNYPYRYTKTKVQSMIADDGYIPVANADDLNAINTAYTGGSTRVFAAGTIWETAAINTTGLADKYIQVNSISLDHTILSTLYGSTWYSAVTGWPTIADGGGETAFTGEFDGCEFEISGLYIRGSAEAQTYSGLFGKTGVSTIKNIRLFDVDIVVTYSGGLEQYSGGLVGIATGTDFSNIEVTGVINTTKGYIGGIIGLGQTACVIIKSCFSGNVISAGNDVGGIVGSYAGSTMKNCYTLGVVTGDTYVGGLMGHANYCVTGTIGIFNSFAACIITGGASYVGGAIGRDSGSTLVGIYYDSDVSGQADVDKGDGRSTSQLKTATFNQTIGGDIVYADYSSYIWDFGTMDQYPVIIRRPLVQVIPADFMGVFTKGVNNPLVDPADTHEFYPPDVVIDGTTYYAIAKCTNAYTRESSSANGSSAWSATVTKLLTANVPWAVASKIEGHTIIKKDGVYYVFFGVRISDGSELHTSIGMAHSTTIDGDYTFHPTAILDFANNDSLADIGMSFTEWTCPDIIKVGSTYYWLFTCSNEIGNWVNYLVMGTSPADDWLNITFTKVFWHSDDIDQVLTRSVTILQMARIFYYDGWYYMIFTAGTWGEERHQRDLFVARSLTIDGFDFDSIQNTPILEGGDVAAWDEWRVYANAVLRDIETKLTPILVDGKLRIFYSGHAMDWDVNTGLMGLAELAI
jgi:hypothetical protein